MQSPRVTRSEGSCGSCNLPYERDCNTHCCPVNCEWGTWRSWSTCSATCGRGTYTRSRTYVRQSSCGGSSCQGSSTETTSCNFRCCPVNCRWGSWSNWGACSATCGGGTSTRTRTYVRHFSCGGSFCQGSFSETKFCNANCCPVDCEWGEWVDLGKCTSICGTGFQFVSRKRVKDAACGGICFGGKFDFKVCNRASCANSSN